MIPMSSDDYLEQALREYDERISRLESDDSVPELIEAYVNRGTVLMMMESFVLAAEDFEEAIDMIESEESAGNEVDVGLYIRAYENRGQMNRGSDTDLMVSDYRKIVSKLPLLNPRTRYFKLNDIVRMCIDCAEDLIDESHWEEAVPFVDKALDAISGRIGKWEDNSRAHLYSLKAEISDNGGSLDDAVTYYGKAVEINRYLDANGQIDSRMQLVFDLIGRGEVENDNGQDEECLNDYVEACSLLEELIDDGQSRDEKLMSDVCKLIASIYVEKGDITGAEKYIVKGLKYDVPGMDHAIDVLGIRRSE